MIISVVAWAEWVSWDTLLCSSTLQWIRFLIQHNNNLPCLNTQDEGSKVLVSCEGSFGYSVQGVHENVSTSTGWTNQTLMFHTWACLAEQSKNVRKAIIRWTISELRSIQWVPITHTEATSCEQQLMFEQEYLWSLLIKNEIKFPIVPLRVLRVQVWR